MIPQIVLFCALTALSSTAFALQHPTAPEMIPLPQSATLRPGSFSITSQMHVILGDGLTEKDLRLVQRFADLAEHHTRRRPPVTDEGAHRKLTKGSLYLATPASDFARSVLGAQSLRRLGAASPDEYVLDVREDGISLVARSERGRFYGMMTLIAILRSEGRRLLLPAVTIHDWPERPVRGFSLAADGPPERDIENLRRLLPVCGSYKLNTIILRLPDEPRVRTRWTAELPRIQPLASEHWIEIQLDSGASAKAQQHGPELRLGFLPPGPDVSAAIASAAHRENSPPSPFVPSLVLEKPAVCSAAWLDYCAAWIAQSSWSDAQADLGSFNRVFFRGLFPGQPGADENRRLFSTLQTSQLHASWDELWIRPSLVASCPHRAMRRHAAESLTADRDPHPDHDATAAFSALSLRVRFLQFIAARLRAEDMLSVFPHREISSLLPPVHIVLESLDRLEAGILDAHVQSPVSPELVDLLGAVGFQRRLWSEIRQCLEAGQASRDLMPPQQWMTGAGELESERLEPREFRRRFQCPEAPLQATLVLSSFCPVVAVVNGSVVAGAPVLVNQPYPGHALMWVIELRDHLMAGENLLVLIIRAADEHPRTVSATLELQYRGGVTATIGVDSLWSSRTVPRQQELARPEASWKRAAVNDPPACPE